ncbi:MAG: Gfo/Idh/MocA family oxidoreductase, partial [Lentisphaeria bacterium]|nr:Gfo/Idh/MocA family oxidoreductase [Lentisphaeria bacterium]
MATRLGLVGLCTSHPNSWIPIIRTLAEEGMVDVEVTACWDSGETRPDGFAAEFAAEKQIPHAVGKLEDMVGLVDAVIVHTTNWDKHVEQARPFIEAGLPVLIDKPVAGNLADIRQLLDWEKTGAKITGGSSLRFVFEVAEYLARPVEERGEVHTAFAGCGTDEYNYGIHAYSLLCGLMGTGLRSVTYLGMSGQKHIRCRWANGSVGFLSVGGEGQRLPFHVIAIAAKGLQQIRVDNSKIYRALLEAT